MKPKEQWLILTSIGVLLTTVTHLNMAAAAMMTSGIY